MHVIQIVNLNTYTILTRIFNYALKPIGPYRIHTLTCLNIQTKLVVVTKLHFSSLGLTRFVSARMFKYILSKLSFSVYFEQNIYL